MGPFHHVGVCGTDKPDLNQNLRKRPTMGSGGLGGGNGDGGRSLGVGQGAFVPSVLLEMHAGLSDSHALYSWMCASMFLFTS